MTKRVLRKQVSEKMKIYFMGVLFIVLTIGIINACNIWQGEAVKKDFYNHIPAIQVYQSNGLLGDNILFLQKPKAKILKVIMRLNLLKVVGRKV